MQVLLTWRHSAAVPSSNVPLPPHSAVPQQSRLMPSLIQRPQWPLLPTDGALSIARVVGDPEATISSRQESPTEPSIEIVSAGPEKMTPVSVLPARTSHGQEHPSPLA